MTENILSIDGRSVNANALCCKGKMHYCVALASENRQTMNTHDFCVSVCSPLVERQKKIYFKRSLKENENSSYICKIFLR